MRNLMFVILFSSAVAHAELVTIDAAAIPTGTNLYSYAPGALVFSITNNGVAGRMAMSPVITVPNPWATGAGPNFIGHANSTALVARWDFRNVMDLEYCLDGACSWSDFFNPLVAGFNTPTSFVEVQVHFPREAIDGAILRAYNSSGDLLETCRFWGDRSTPRAPQLGMYPTRASPTCGEVVRRYECNRSGTSCKVEYRGRIQRGNPDIAYVFWGGEAASATVSAISRITFLRY